MNVSPIKAAIIGLGRMGQRHIEAAQKMGMEVCGLVDISDTALAQTAQKFHINPKCCYTQASDMIRHQKPEALVVATTAPTHAQYTILAAQNHVTYILCEKPMAVSLNEAWAMIDACQHYGAHLAINHQMMFLPQYTEIKKIIEEGHFGPLSSIMVSGSNFGLAMNASHYFEMFRYLTNTPITSIQAWLDEEKVPNPRGPQFEDNSGFLIAKNDQGVRMHLDFSLYCGHGLQVIYLFKYGQVMVDELSGFVRSICRKEEFKDLPTTRYGMPADTQQYELKAFEMIDSTLMVWKSMLSKREYPDFNAGLHAMTCLLAAIESQERGNHPIATAEITIDKARQFKWA